MKFELSEFLKNKKVIGLALGLGGILIVFLIVFTFGLWPVAFVNGAPIFAFQYQKATDLAFNYFANYSSNDQSKEKLKKGSRAIALEGLIDEILIDKKLKSEMKRGELEEKIENHIKPFLDDQEARRLLSKLIRLPEKDIIRYFLRIQAKNQILDSRLRLEKKDLISWLIEERKKAKVIILVPGIKWTEEGVKLI